MSCFRWGIFGTGEISAKFVAGLASARHAEATFVASRSLERAQSFAKGLGIPTAIEGYANAALAGGVDAIYIATPPSEHAQHALLCIEAGIPVLVEKPFATSAQDAETVATAARSRSVFAMEAMWTRFLPAAQALRDHIASGQLGDIRIVTGNFGTSQVPSVTNGVFNPALGGGALAHLGSYPLSLGQWLFGSPSLVQAIGNVGQTGVEEDVAIQLVYPRDVLGSFFVSLRSWAPDEFYVLGVQGMAGLAGSVVRPTGLNLTREEPRLAATAQFGWRSHLRQHDMVHRFAQKFGISSRAPVRHIAHPYSGNGYHYEADAVRSCVERGDLESAIMPLAESIAVASTIDLIRGAVLDDVATKSKQI